MVARVLKDANGRKYITHEAAPQPAGQEDMAVYAAIAANYKAATTVVEPNPWREAVIDRLVVLWNLTGDNENDPRQAMNDIERMVAMMALDPDISSEAQALIDRGRAEATPPRAALTVDEAIHALSSALAESKGWLRDYSDAVIRDAIDRREPRAALTDAQLLDILQSLDACTARLPGGFRLFARAVEAAHNIGGPRNE